MQSNNNIIGGLVQLNSRNKAISINTFETALKTAFTALFSEKKLCPKKFIMLSMLLQKTNKQIFQVKIVSYNY